MQVGDGNAAHRPRGRVGAAPEPLVVARQVAAPHPALHRAGVPLDRVLVLTVIAFFAVLFTGRYPRGIFDFNVGVLRWTWRVAFYTFGALGTDQYPPFTLDCPSTRHARDRLPAEPAPRPPPDRLVAARGPAVLHRGDLRRGGMVARLVGILVLVAGVLLLFKDRYPTDIFDLVLGLDRWVLRVIAYAAFMTREYPPFRLDPGQREPSFEMRQGQTA